VGLGRDEFEYYMSDPKRMERRYKSGAFKESFAYCFHEPEPPRTEANKQSSRELLVKHVAALEKQLVEIEFQLSTVRGCFHDINMLLGQVLEDTKKSN
jgi:hypothetical protein